MSANNLQGFRSGFMVESDRCGPSGVQPGMDGLIVLTSLMLTGRAVPPVQDSLPERLSITIACGWAVPPPGTLAEWVQRANLVVRVRIDSHHPFDHEQAGGDPTLMMAVEATVLDVVKAHRRGVAEGASQQILQFGGRIRRLDHIEVSMVNGMAILPQGSEWLLFLEWNARLDGFTFFYGELGAVQVEHGKIANWRGASAWEGRPIGQLVAALRAR
jgi:hypothetical protein